MPWKGIRSGNWRGGSNPSISAIFYFKLVFAVVWTYENMFYTIYINDWLSLYEELKIEDFSKGCYLIIEIAPFGIKSWVSDNPKLKTYFLQTLFMKAYHNKDDSNHQSRHSYPQ